MKRTSALALLILATVSSSCLWMEQRTMRSGTRRPLFDAREVTSIEAGKTTRAEVLLLLGQPFWASEDERLLVYADIAASRFTGLLGVVPMDMASAQFELYLVQFDPVGIVTRTGFRAGQATDLYEVLDARWVASAAVAEWTREGKTQ